ncbi:MAG TPA: FtsW/RodA/SpoVE family cell cycle protein [Bryobacteraceae bacterium]|nr:FtsW/RodA/SpoVE family cell cycle protein [Bryobacteraceae bacterium]
MAAAARVCDERIAAEARLRRYGAMAVTRRSDNRLGLELALMARANKSVRRREFLLLCCATILVAAAFLFTMRAKTRGFADAQTQLQRGELLNLNAAIPAASIGGMLQASTGTQLSSDQLRRLEEYLARSRPLPNVGALAHLHLFPLARLKPHLVVRTPHEFYVQFALWSAIYLGAFWLVHLLWRALQFRGDPYLLPALELLTGFGFVLMLSLRDPLRDTLEFRKFAWGCAAGCLLLLAPLFKFFQTRNFARLVYTPLLAALALFAALLRFGSGPTGSDAHVNLGPFQPVEVIKILLIFFLAGYFAQKWNWLRDLHEKRWVPSWLRWLELPRVSHAVPVMCAVACALLMFFVLKDMGPAMITGLVFLVLFAIARKRSGLALLGMALLIGGFVVGYRLGTPHTVVERVSMWLSPWDNNVRGGDQLAHSLWGFATGGPFGSGPGQGDPSVIPAGHTDLVLPAVAEEWGFPGVAIICFLFAVLVSRAFRIAVRAPDEYALFLAAGFGSLLACEMLLISGGVLGAIPLSGVVSPFLSSGNTAMLANFFICAVLAGISNQVARTDSWSEATREPVLAPLFGKPMRVAAAVLSICAIGLLGKAAWIELFQDQELLSKDALVYTSDGVKRPEHNPRLSLLAASIPRGDIYDRNGILLATSDRQKLEAERARYEQLGVSLDHTAQPGQSRYYPFGTATLHLLGDFRTGERFHATNASFVEHDSNQKLQGYRDYHELAQYVRYRHRPDNPEIAALFRRTRDVLTTIDIRLQLKLDQLVEQHFSKGEKGAAILMNAASGDVLALASWPLPTAENATTDELLDRARYGEYPPGSTFKLVTAAAALALDPNAEQRTFRCSRLADGRAGVVIRGWRRPVRDDIGDRVHGTLDLKQAITVSCNAYFAQLGVFAVGSNALVRTAARFGIKAGSEQEVKQMLPFAAYGQGTVVATPLQMARVAATVAGEGKMPQGRWVLDGSDGRNAAALDTLSEQTAEVLAAAMRNVVASGTARSAMTGAEDLRIAGKTGTAQLDHGQPHSWFIGFAPYDAPVNERIAFAVIVEHGGYGAKTAAPFAREMLEAAADLGLLKR